MPQTFYRDFIIRFASGKIGIFDTKSGNTAKEATPRAQVLAKYIRDQTEQGKNLIGGIVIQDRKNDWKFNQKPIYSYDMNDLRDWNTFDEID